MSQENVERLRQGYEAVNAFFRGELSSGALVEFADPQIEFHWHAGRTMPDEPQHLRGIPEVMGWMEDFREAWDEVVQEPHEFIEGRDGRVLVSVRQSGRGRESGVPLVIHFFELITIRNGNVRKVELFRHRDDALEAAGLRE